MTKDYPNLFIPGAAKSGTSTLHELLNQHPEICMSSNKEPFFWVQDSFDRHTASQVRRYLELFSTTSNVKFKGESSTAYMLFPNFIERIKAHYNLPVKFIFILRNPIDRLYSHYKYIKGVGSEKLGFKEAVLADKNLEPDPSTQLPEGRFKSYYQYGLYGKWLTRFYENFEPENLKIIVFEDLIRNPLDVANACYNFLGLEELKVVKEVHKNDASIIKHQNLYQTIMKLSRAKLILMKPIYALIPRKTKSKIKRNLSDILIKHSKSNRKFPNLTTDERLWARDLYIDDVNQLKTLTSLPFNQWEEFN